MKAAGPLPRFSAVEEARRAREYTLAARREFEEGRAQLAAEQGALEQTKLTGAAAREAAALMEQRERIALERARLEAKLRAGAAAGAAGAAPAKGAASAPASLAPGAPSAHPEFAARRMELEDSLSESRRLLLEERRLLQVCAPPQIKRHTSLCSYIYI